jgi:hypothetical protein
VRTTQNDDCAVDGLFFLIQVRAWQAMTIHNENEAKNETAERLTPSLSVSDQGFSVVEEKQSSDDKKTKGAAPTKADPKDFDFVVTWVQDNKEAQKRSLSAPVEISGKEIFKVEKVSDPTLSRSWSFAYALNGGSKSEDYPKTSVEQTRTIIIPARGPVLNEIRAFMKASQSK